MTNDDIDSMVALAETAATSWLKEMSAHYDRERKRHDRRVWQEKEREYFSVAKTRRDGTYEWIPKEGWNRWAAGYLVGLEISEGGWACVDGRLKDWMTKADLESAEKRIFKNSQPEDYDSSDMPQCGGCKWFGALNGDWGICCNEKSPQDTRIQFEHSGCFQHSALEAEA